MRALLVLCLLASRAAAELPTIESEFPPTLRVSTSWGVRIERVDVAVRPAPDLTFVTIAVAAGRERTIEIALDVPPSTKIVGLGIDGTDGRAWGRPLPLRHARLQHESTGGALLEWTGTSAGQDHVTINVTAPATLEIALYLPPLPRLAVATAAGLLAVEVGDQRFAGKQRRIVVGLDDIAGMTGEVAMPHADEQIALVAAQTPPERFAPHEADVSRFGPRVMRDLDKMMIRRRMKWYRPQLRECFMYAAQWANGPRSGGAVVTFMVVADGTVDWARTSESDLPARVNECLVEQVKRWTFPEADGNVQVNYPLDFRTYE